MHGIVHLHPRGQMASQVGKRCITFEVTDVDFY